MGKIKKTDLKKVIKKAERETGKNPVSDLKEHTTKPIAESANKRKKSKEKIDDGKKKGTGKAGVKQKPGGKKDKPPGEKSPRGGGKTPVQRPPGKREKAGLLDRILPPWF